MRARFASCVVEVAHLLVEMEDIDVRRQRHFALRQGCARTRVGSLTRTRQARSLGNARLAHA
eukprot:3871593-Pleurochrysis_carterae.AAC.2